jgi:hypothetical protein
MAISSSYMQGSAIVFDAATGTSTRPNPPTALKTAVQVVP